MERAVGFDCVRSEIGKWMDKSITKRWCFRGRKMDEADEGKEEDKLEGSHARVNGSVNR